MELHRTPDVRRDVYSVSKTFTSVAIGLAEAEGRLSVDDPILAHLPEFAAGAAEGVEAITVDHLLQMTSGIVYRWDDPDADHPGDPAHDMLATPLGSAPGTAFAYRGANSYLLSRIVEACTGEELRDFLLPRLFLPLGIGNPQWLRCPRGFSLGAVGLLLRTEEIARLGRALLNGGRYGRRQLIPADYVRAMIDDPVETDGHLASRAGGPSPESRRYGRHVWLCARDGAWRMDGIYGQFCILLPAQHACITVTAQYQGPTTDILNALWSDLVPGLS